MSTAAVERLRSGRDIAAVFRGRQQRAARLMALHARRRAEDGPTRVAVIASRRVGSAVARNRAKRLLREASRRVDWAPNLDVVLVARAACAESGLGPVEAELESLARSLRITREVGA